MDDDKMKEEIKAAISEACARLYNETSKVLPRVYCLPYYEKGIFKGWRVFSEPEYRQYINTLASECDFEEDNHG